MWKEIIDNHLKTIYGPEFWMYAHIILQDIIEASQKTVQTRRNPVLPRGVDRIHRTERHYKGNVLTSGFARDTRSKRLDYSFLHILEHVLINWKWKLFRISLTEDYRLPKVWCGRLRVGNLTWPDYVTSVTSANQTNRLWNSHQTPSGW